jgi:hypothetical protein
MCAQNGQQWLLLTSLAQLYLLLTFDLSKSQVHNLSQLAKRLEDSLGTQFGEQSLWPMKLYKNLEEEKGTL